MNPDPSKISISDYHYELPEGRIARFPLARRDRSKILIMKAGGHPESGVFSDIITLFPGGSLMVFNNTRVIRARLLFRKPSGAAIEVFCLEPATAAIETQVAFSSRGEVLWRCLIGNARRWKDGPLLMKLSIDGTDVILEATRAGLSGDAFLIRFRWNSDHNFASILESAGSVPLPPYLHREAVDADKDRYQTVYAQHDGSVAAPTAGLHFTPAMLQQLKQQGVATANVTLHVSAGTFRPVNSPTISGHTMHQEAVIISRELITQLQAHLDNTITAVGTTTVRTLESIYWLGVRIIEGNHVGYHFSIDQWEPYQERLSLPPAADSLRAVADFMDKNGYQQLLGFTSLIIVPGYHFQFIHRLITNFHMPGSTLLLLVAAFIGPAWRKAYEFALDGGFRFLSYGDACLFIRK